MSDMSRLFDVWYSLKCGPCNRYAASTLDYVGSSYQIYAMDDRELSQLPVTPRLREALSDKSLDEASRVVEFCEARQIDIIFRTDKNYPCSLNTLIDPPVILYCKGKLPDMDKKLCVAVVGTRSMTEYGKSIAYRFGYELASSGTVVVSGMALGIDGMAAAGACAASGTTVAVLGSGIDVIYPSAHRTLYDVICQNGAVLTEYPPGTRPERYTFPQRNRIISGLSQATVVVEADSRSGSMITARYALIQGRQLYAVPGNVGNPGSEGTNALIMNGAAMAVCARDILNDFTGLFHGSLDFVKLSAAENSSSPDEHLLSRWRVSVKTSRPIPSMPDKTSPAGVLPPTFFAEEPTDFINKYANPDGKVPSDDEQSVLPERLVKAYESLSVKHRELFDSMPGNQAVSLEQLLSGSATVQDVVSALTVFEIKGLIKTVPGGLYQKTAGTSAP